METEPLRTQQFSGSEMLLCPFCESSEVSLRFVAARYSFFTCKSCSSLFRADADEVSDVAYDEAYYGDSPDEKFWLKPVIWLLGSERRGRARFLRRMHPAATAITDAGCGNGALLAAIHKTLPAAVLTGIEMDNVAARRAAQHDFIHVLTSPFGKENMPGASQDILLMIHSFEHMPQPRLIIHHAARLLRENAVFYCAIPDVSSLQFRLFGKMWLHLDPEYHLHFISPQMLAGMAAENGLMLYKRRLFNPVQNIPGFILSSLDVISGRRNVLFDLLRNRRLLKKPFNVLLLFVLMLLSVLLLPLALLAELISIVSGRPATTDYVFKKSSD